MKAKDVCWIVAIAAPVVVLACILVGIFASDASNQGLPGAGYGGRGPTIDPNTGAMKTIDVDHAAIPEGVSYDAHYSVTTAATDDHRTCIGFESTGSSIHMTVRTSASDPAEAFLYEAPTVDDNAGTDVVVFNRDRNSSNTSVITTLENPVESNKVTRFTEAQVAAANLVTSTHIGHMVLIAGGGPKAIGGEGTGTHGWILKYNTKYVIVIQNTAANANTHLIDLSWHECTN